MSSKPLLSARSLSKGFGHILAVSEVGLTVSAGEVLGIVGDNGAGKSTLMRLLSGRLKPDGGTIEVCGVPVSFRSPRDARRAGVAAVSQDLGVVESLDIATNIFLGDFPRRGPFVDRRRMSEETQRVLARVGIADRSPTTAVGLLSAGHRQFVAIARALRLEAPIVLMDEPTAALGVRETAEVAGLLDDLRRAGKAVVLISHDLGFVLEHCDRIQVLRLGSTAGVRRRGDTDRDELVSLITGTLEHGDRLEVHT